MLEQLPHADRADVLNQIQCHQGFVGLHARGIAGSQKRGKRKGATIRRPNPETRRKAEARKPKSGLLSGLVSA
jgi:hypothetical protein